MEIYNFMIIIGFSIHVHGLKDKQNPRIAIIGGGIGGTSSGQFLRNLFGKNAIIDLYEADTVGGRVATIDFNNRVYECGGSILHPANQYSVDFARFLDLHPAKRHGGNLAIWNGEKFVFNGNKWGPLMVGQLLWRYGYDMVRIQWFVKELLKDFKRIYHHQDNGFAFSSVKNLLSSMSPRFVDMLEESIQDAMKEAGIGRQFIDELVRGGMRTNYGQDIDIQAFVGSVSMAGIEPGLWSVEGGNKRIAEELIKHSQVNFYQRKVTKISLSKDGSIPRYTIHAEDDATKAKEGYDLVIFAVPLHENSSGIQFENFPSKISIPVNYHRTVATFVKGIPRASTFELLNADSFPTAMFTSNSSLFFNSIGFHLPVDFSPDENPQSVGVYKVFSKEELTKNEIDYLFQSHTHVKVVDWTEAYPAYSSKKNFIPSFSLDDYMFYPNAIEMAASAIEMSIIGARNSALLAFNKWNDIDKIDSAEVYSHSLHVNLEL